MAASRSVRTPGGGPRLGWREAVRRLNRVPSISMTTLSPGVARLAWGPDRPAVTDLRAAIEAAHTTHHRVEVQVPLADTEGQRLCLFAGLRQEGVARGALGEGPAGQPLDAVVLARVLTDPPAGDPVAFRAMLNSFLPRKRAIGQMLIRDEQDRVLMCQLTYKKDWDLPGGVIEVGENPRTGVIREVQEELSLDLPAERLLLTDWMPSWSGWDDALCLVFDGGRHPHDLTESVVRQEREIAAVAFLDADEVAQVAADFTARRVASALAMLAHSPSGGGFSESGRLLAG